jgi:serine/threonine protein kinase
MSSDISGQTLLGRYELRHQIGRGGFATVYEALDRRLDKQVAIKILSPRYAAREEYRLRFIQEARAAARLRHRLLVDVTDHGLTADGVLFFVMEHLHGSSLAERLHQHPGPVPWTWALPLTLEVVKALEVAHQHQIVHRDVKPGNVFLVGGHISGPELQVKLLDLGIAKIHYHVPEQEMPRTRDSQGTPGTPEYMAPEQIQGSAKGPSIDLYAVGVLLYRLVTGTTPFSGKASWEVLRMHVEQQPIRPSLRAPTAAIPPEIDHLILRLLAKHPDDRYRSATELRHALEELIRRRSQRPPPTITTATAPRGRSTEHLLRLAAACLGLSTAALTFMLLQVFSHPALRDAPPRAGDTNDLLELPAPSAPPLRASTPIAVNTPPQAPSAAPLSPPSEMLLPPAPAPDPTTLTPQLPDPALAAPSNAPAPSVPVPPSTSPTKRPASRAGPLPKQPPEAAVRQRLNSSKPKIVSACKRQIPSPVRVQLTIDLDLGAATVDLLGDLSRGAACVKAQVESLRFPKAPGHEPLVLRETFDL